MALAYARSRKAEYHTDDGWVRDPQSDLSRIVRQQTLMTEALDEALREADNPVRLRELVDIGTANVTIDSGLTLGDVRELADRVRDLGADSFHTVSLPVLPRPGDEDSTVVVDERRPSRSSTSSGASTPARSARRTSRSRCSTARSPTRPAGVRGWPAT